MPPEGQGVCIFQPNTVSISTCAIRIDLTLFLLFAYLLTLSKTQDSSKRRIQFHGRPFLFSTAIQTVPSNNRRQLAPTGHACPSEVYRLLGSTTGGPPRRRSILQLNNDILRRLKLLLAVDLTPGTRKEHTAFALTSSAVSDGGKFTRQFFRGTRATSAVLEGFLGAISSSTLFIHTITRNPEAGNVEEDTKQRELTFSALAFPPDSAGDQVRACVVPPSLFRRAGPPCASRTETYSAPTVPVTCHSRLGQGLA